jgi:hypothetical protein
MLLIAYFLMAIPAAADGVSQVKLPEKWRFAKYARK